MPPRASYLLTAALFAALAAPARALDEPRKLTFDGVLPEHRIAPDQVVAAQAARLRRLPRHARLLPVDPVQRLLECLEALRRDQPWEKRVALFAELG